MTDWLKAGDGNIICPGYDNHEARILPKGEEYALTDDGHVCCDECRKKWAANCDVCDKRPGKRLQWVAGTETWVCDECRETTP